MSGSCMRGAKTRALVLGALAPRHLLQLEGVAVRIGEVRSLDAAAEVLDVADLDTSADELGACLGDVLHDQVQAPDTARFTGVDVQPSPEPDRAARALRSQLDDPDALAGLHVEVLLEAELVGIEGDGSVHVRNRERDEFQLHAHRSQAPLSGCGPRDHAIRPPRLAEDQRATGAGTGAAATSAPTRTRPAAPT